MFKIKNSKNFVLPKGENIAKNSNILISKEELETFQINSKRQEIAKLFELCCSENPLDPSINKGIFTAKIEILDEFKDKIIRAKAMAYSPKDREEFSIQIKELLDLGVIEPNLKNQQNLLQLLAVHKDTSNGQSSHLASNKLQSFSFRSFVNCGWVLFLVEGHQTMEAQGKGGNIVKTQSLEACQVTKLTWRIDNFSMLNVKKLFSEIFMVSGYRWRIFIYPKGNRVDNYLSLYIEVVDAATAPVGWFVDADVIFNLIDQIDCRKTVDHETKCTFKGRHASWGYATFISLNQLHDLGRGYLLDDTCIIEVEVSVSAASPVSVNKDQPADSSVAVDLSINNPIYLDTMDSIYIKAQSFLKSRSKRSFSSISDAIVTGSSAQDDGSLVKGHFNELISLPLDDLADPKHESVMRESLSTLGNDLTSFSEEQIEQIKRLKIEFPRIIEDWRDSVQVLVSCQSFLLDFEKTGNLLENAVKTEEGIKAKMDKLKIRYKELEKELEAARKEEKQLIEQRREASKNTHQFYVMAEEQNVKIEDKELEIGQVREELQDLKAEWDTIRSHFT
ncbi:MATH domain and coiled-coil domain-containing protein-like [Forsythia ovata]|uniref:MATH domain and coiled-coil domain-containing protein-like n=1 Tax=Forsythia ovata TaxID=205694 RepID=A0ABD1X5S6_9LAMI